MFLDKDLWERDGVCWKDVGVKAAELSYRNEVLGTRGTKNEEKSRSCGDESRECAH